MIDYSCPSCHSVEFIRLEHIVIDSKGKAVQAEDSDFQCSGCSLRIQLLPAPDGKFEVAVKEQQPVRQAPESVRQFRRTISSASADERRVDAIHKTPNPRSQDPRFRGDTAR
jgi:hypothetical protein